MGESIGETAGSIISTVTGMGTYHVNQNTLAFKSAPTPTFARNDKGIRICHREFLADVRGSVEFENKSYQINPGIPRSFPWLSQLAGNFTQYKMHGLLYEFRPTSGMVTSSAGLGSVQMATNYNPNAEEFRSKREVDSYNFATSVVPWKSALHAVECKPSLSANPIKWIRDTSVAIPLVDTDVGLFQISTQGQPSEYTLGELWVTYDVELIQQKLDLAETPGYWNEACWHVRENPMGTMTPTKPFGSSGPAFIVGDNRHDVYFNGTSITFYRSGHYFLFACVRGDNEQSIAQPRLKRRVTAEDVREITLGDPDDGFQGQTVSQVYFRGNGGSDKDIYDQGMACEVILVLHDAPYNLDHTDNELDPWKIDIVFDNPSQQTAISAHMDLVITQHYVQDTPESNVDDGLALPDAISSKPVYIAIKSAPNDTFDSTHPLGSSGGELAAGCSADEEDYEMTTSSGFPGGDMPCVLVKKSGTYMASWVAREGTGGIVGVPQWILGTNTLSGTDLTLRIERGSTYNATHETPPPDEAHAGFMYFSVEEPDADSYVGVGFDTAPPTTTDGNTQLTLCRIGAWDDFLA